MADGASDKPLGPERLALDWSHALDEVGSRGLRSSRTASARECEAVARQLDLVACRSLSASYHIRPMAGGAFFVEGRLTARVTQACVVTLDPVEADIEEGFTIEFREPGDIEPLSASEAAFDPDEADDPEPIRHGRLCLGPVIIDHLLLALDPYPRKPGASLDQSKAGAGDEPRANPFAVLGKLKPKA